MLTMLQTYMTQRQINFHFVLWLPVVLICVTPLAPLAIIKILCHCDDKIKIGILTQQHEIDVLVRINSTAE